MERFLRLTPQKANNFGRAGSYGSWFNFYLCAAGRDDQLRRHPLPAAPDSTLGSLPDPTPPGYGGPMQRMKPFRKRNPLPIGAASLAILLLLTAASLNIRDLPLIGQGPTYSARFSESAGVQPDDDVRIAGIRIGTVTDLELDGKDVVISFKAPDAWVGDRTSASIEIKTVLGQKYINLEPAGEAPLDPDASIPRERTRAPFDVIQAFSQLSTTVEDLDTDQLASEPRRPVRDPRRRRRSGPRCARRPEPALAHDLLARPGAGPAAGQHPDDHPGAGRPRRRGRTTDQRRQPAAR